MSLAQGLSAYLNINLLILMGFFILCLLSTLKTRLKLNAIIELKLHYATLTAIIALGLAHPLFPKNTFTSPAAKLWSARSTQTFYSEYSESNSYIDVTTPIGSSYLSTSHFNVLWSMLALFIFIFNGALFIRNEFSLYQFKKSSFKIRKLGRVHILVNQTIQIPFSFWVPGQATIIIPPSIVNHPKHYKIAISHELQHHRQRNTVWLYILFGLRSICVFNPIIHIWNRWISQLQEFACDETLVDLKKVSPQAYASCLIEVAQSALNYRYQPAYAAGLKFLIERKLLKKRIERMVSKSTTLLSNKAERPIVSSFAASIVLLMGVTAFASKGLIQDRRITLTQAQEMAAQVQSGSTKG